MTEVCGNIKTLLADMQGKGLSSTAKLVAILESCGIEDRTEIENLLEARPSTIREARAALKIQRQKSSADDTTAGNPAPEIQRCAGNPAIAPEIQRSEPVALACVSNTTRATNELPTEVSSYIEVSYPLAPMPIVKPKRLRSQGSRLPDDFELPEDWRQWAKVNCFASDAQIDTEAANFADYWIAKPSQATSLDWKRTWQKWARKSFSPAGNRRPQSTGTYGASPEKHQVEGISAMIARLKSEGAIQ